MTSPPVHPFVTEDWGEVEIDGIYYDVPPGAEFHEDGRPVGQYGYSSSRKSRLELARWLGLP